MSSSSEPGPPRAPEPTAAHVPEPVSTVHTTVRNAATADLPGPGVAQYRLGAELARGGMGVVYRAEDLVFGREVAVKVLGPGLEGTTAAARFVDEARITAQLSHPGVPPVHAMGTLPDGRPYLVMKLIQGKTLAQRLADRESLSDKLEGFAQVFEQICQTVAFAHFKGVIHRDLKPSNIMVGNFGEVQVMDWGLAKQLAKPERERRGEDTGGASEPEFANPDVTPLAPELPQSGFPTRPVNHAEGRTVAGAVMGTPAYMPPEQARGQLERVNERSDVFALGGILCAILTGHAPYIGANGREVMRQAEDGNLEGAGTRLSAATAELASEEEAVIAGPLVLLARKCLNPDPLIRPADAAKVAALAGTAISKIAQLRRQIELDHAVANIPRDSLLPLQLGLLKTLGCGLRIMLLLGIVVFLFVMLGPCRAR